MLLLPHIPNFEDILNNFSRIVSKMSLLHCLYHSPSTASFERCFHFCILNSHQTNALREAQYSMVLFNRRFMCKDGVMQHHYSSVGIINTLFLFSKSSTHDTLVKTIHSLRRTFEWNKGSIRLEKWKCLRHSEMCLLFSQHKVVNPQYIMFLDPSVPCTKEHFCFNMQDETNWLNKCDFPVVKLMDFSNIFLP